MMKKQHLLACFSIIGVSFLIYLNSFSAPFQFDDYMNLSENKSMRVQTLSPSELYRVVKPYPNYLRPIPFLTFALNYYFGKTNVFGYHLVNVLVHAVAGIALYFFLYLTLNLVSSTPHSPLPTPYSPLPITPLLISLLWLAHPVQTQAVTYIVQRMTSMATMFYLLSLVFYIKGRLSMGYSSANRNPRIATTYFIASSLFAFFSFGSKEISITLPLTIILYEAFFFRKPGGQRKRGRMLTLILLGIAFAVVVYAIFRGRFPTKVVFSGEILRGVNALYPERLINEIPVLVHYLTLLLLPLPSRLVFDYDFTVFPPLTIAFSAILLLGILVYALSIRRKNPLLSFFLLWFPLTTALEAGATLYRAELAFEHRLYLPSVGLITAGVLLLERWTNVIEEALKIKWRIFLPFILVLLLFCSIWTIKRNVVWKDELTLWEDTVRKAPGNPRARTNLGLTLFKRGKLNEAIEELEKALKLGNYGKTHYILAMVLAEKGDTKRALEEYRIAELVGEHYCPETHFDLGNLSLKQEDYDEAIKEYERAIFLKPNYVEAYLHLANCQQMKGLTERAIATYKKLIEINPGVYEAHYNLGLLYLNQKKFTEAFEEFDRAVRINPGLAETVDSLRQYMVK